MTATNIIEQIKEAIKFFDVGKITGAECLDLVFNALKEED